MTFYVNGIKQDKIQDNEQDISLQGGKESKAKTLPVELLFLSDNETLVKEVLESIHLIILSFGVFKEDLDTFGKIYAKIVRKGQTLEIRTPLTNIKTFCSNLFRLGLDVVDLNSYQDPIEPEIIQKLLASSRQEVVAEHKEESTQIQEKKNIEKKIYTDPKLNVSKEAIDWLITKIPVITQRTDRSLSFGELKQLRDLGEELKKLKMGNNYEKIKEQGQKLFSLVETLNDRYYAGILTQATTPIPESIVTDIDIYKALDSMDFAKQSSKLGVSTSIERNAYIYLGPLMVFFTLVRKDIEDMISRPISLLYRLYDIVGIGVLFSLCLAAASLIGNPLFLFIPNLSGMYYRMVYVGILGFVMFIIKYFRKKNILNLLLIYIITLCAYFLGRYIIVTNFAL